jgi:hypothetical protein
MSEARITELLNNRGLVSNTTGVVAIAKQLAPAAPFRLREIRLHLNAVGGAGDFTATLDANEGVAYDLLITKQDMTATADYIYIPDKPLQFESGDKINFAWANAGGKTYGLTIIYDLL